MKSIKMKDMQQNELPRERLLRVGVNNLSNEELISIILKTGTKDMSVKTLSSVLLSKFKNINDFKNISVNYLTKFKGIGKVKAIELVASLELGKRVYYQKAMDKITLNTTVRVYEYFKDIFYGEKQENFYAIYLDTKNNLISYKLLFKGTINSSCVHPREIFKYAFLESAYAIIVMHNHPSGDVTPSSPDIELTSHLFEIGKIVSIPVLDHIIIGNNSFYSFYEKIKEN